MRSDRRAARGGLVRALRGRDDVDRLGAILRAGTVVELDGVGSLHSGK